MITKNEVNRIKNKKFRNKSLEKTCNKTIVNAAKRGSDIAIIDVSQYSNEEIRICLENLRAGRFRTDRFGDKLQVYL